MRATLHRFAGTFSGATTVYVPRPVMAPLKRCVGVPSLTPRFSGSDGRLRYTAMDVLRPDLQRARGYAMLRWGCRRNGAPSLRA
eukprot:COSAG04_NODE_1607_length_6175_cov_6.046906_5_plen_84_part_00